MTKISIITVVRNNKRFIECCIKSVIGQTYKNLEYIIIDGASTDGTLDIIDKYADRGAKIFSEKDEGFVYAMNKGLGRASGDVIGFLHSDDFYADNGVIQKVADSFASDDTDSLYGDLMYVSRKDPDKVLRYWRGGEYSEKKIGWGWMPPHPAFFVKKRVYEKFGYFNTDFKISADYESILRIFRGHRISTHYLPRVIVKMRFGGVSNSGIKNIIIKTAEDYRACRTHGLGLSTVMMKNIVKLPQFFVK